MNRDYIILDIGKIVIVWENKTKKIFKEENNELIELNDSERIYVENYLNQEQGYIYYSERLENIVKQNPNIEEKEMLLPILFDLESMIPIDSRENFYHNLETLDTFFLLDLVKTTIVEKKSNHLNPAFYNIKENRLHLDNFALKEVLNISMETTGNDEFYQTYLRYNLFHELNHVASSEFDENSQVSFCGYDKFPASSEEDRNRGLTEGITDAIALWKNPKMPRLMSGYYNEVCIAMQLVNILGVDTMFSPYFKHDGIGKLKEGLQSVIKDEDKSYQLFRRIEYNYQLRKNNEKQTLLGNIQSTLVEYFKEKIKQALLDNSMTPSQIKMALDSYQEFLITPEALIEKGKNPNNYIGLDKSVEEFKEMRAKFELVLTWDTEMNLSQVETKGQHK